MELLYLAKAKKNVLRGDRIGEGAVATVVNKRQDGKLGDALGATMVVGRGQASDIEQSNPTRLSEAFFVARAGRFDEPPHKWPLGTTVLRATRTVRGIKRDMAVDVDGMPSVEGCQVGRGRITPERPLLGRR